MTKFKRILVPFDGSDQAVKALRTAISLSKSYRSELSVLYVSEPVQLPIAPTESTYLIDQGIRQLQELTLRKAGYILKREKFKGELKPATGHPADVVLDYAKAGRFDLIVMGNRGLSGLDRFLLGSVSDSVIHHAGCAVLVVK